METFQMKLNLASSEEEFLDAVNALDADGLGIISDYRIRNVMTTLKKATDEQVDELIKETDTDGDGYINCKDLAKYFMNKDNSSGSK